MREPSERHHGTRGRCETFDEETLVREMIDNHPGAWREFQRRYDRLALRCITQVTRRFAHVSNEDVREIYGILLVSILANDKAKLRAFDPARGARFSSWLGLLALHTAYDYLRGLRREPPKEALRKADEILLEGPDPFEELSHRQRAGIAAQVLSGFSKKDRTFATLYFAEEMSPDEIAVRMKISVKTVYSKKHKIRSRLEALLGPKAA